MDWIGGNDWRKKLPKENQRLRDVVVVNLRVENEKRDKIECR
jgi:hypothetical protein